jgi:ribosomal peptide maturation radical SAM protein 1
MQNERKGRPLRVALVNMPFSSTRFPSIQIGLLQSILAQHGIPATAHYLNLEFAARIGWKRYETLSNSTLYFVGDWIFSRAAFRQHAPDGKGFMARYGRTLSKKGAAFLWEQYEHGAPAFLEECLLSVPWHHYDVVAFSSVFVQNCAALALARMLKERYPQLITVFGGANFEDEMGLEYVRTLPWVDYGVLGEADETFPALLKRLAVGEAIVSMPGIAHRTKDRVDFGGPPPLVRELDQLPIPNYDDFFSAAARLHMPSAMSPDRIQLPFESARGCWWGQKHHCTFCGLNALGMGYRSKSAPRTLFEIEELVSRYRSRYLGAVDNILDQQHIEGVFGVLAAQERDYRFFYEVKANLNRDQIRLLAQGGMRRIQPGIESLSSHLLQLMRKGISAIKNVRLLKWAAYYHVSVSWNVLLGFPGESVNDYTSQVELLKLIPHLPPPSGAYRISLERFSPNYTQAAEMGFENVRPLEAYSYIYPREINTGRIAYFFEYDAQGTLPDSAYASLRNEIISWQKRWGPGIKPYLTYSVEGGCLKIFDGRLPRNYQVHTFDAAGARVYEFCSTTDRGVSSVLAHLREKHPTADRGYTQSLLKDFSARGLMLEEEGHFLSLAIPRDPETKWATETPTREREYDPLQILV